jgi:hypothetical protein
MMMGKLRLGAIVEDKPVRMTIELPAALHRDLLAYAAPHQPAERLVAPMLALFMASDRAFAKGRRREGASDGAGT